MAPYPHEPTEVIKYNHFHEYDDNNEELFEIREITPPPSPDALKSEIYIAPPSSTRVAKLRDVFRRVTGKKRVRQTAERIVQNRTDSNGSRFATLPRMNGERREADLKELRDEMFGEGKYYQEPEPRKLDDWREPEPFVPPIPTRSKTVRWASTSARTRTMHNVKREDHEPHRQREINVNDNSTKQDKVHGNHRNPYWEEDFELPEPELVYNPPSNKDAGRSISGFIPIDLSGIPVANFSRPSTSAGEPTSRDSKGKNVKSNENKGQPKPPPKHAKPTCRCGDPSCTSSCVHVLTAKGVHENLGPEVADLIVTQLILRLGPPLPLPPRDPEETEPTCLAIRNKVVIQTYAKWAATFMFQKLVVAIKLSLDRFTPSHRGLLNFEFQVTPDLQFPLLTYVGLSHFQKY
jgi:hypothetical protein